MRNIDIYKEYRKTHLIKNRYKSIIGLILFSAIFILSLLNSQYSQASTLPVKIKSIAGGAMHSAAVGADGSVWTWGDNYYGQLGDGSKISKSIPTKIKGLSDFKAIACGANYTLALKGDGTVWAWGHNLCKQLGNGVYTQSIPAKINGLNNVKALACGYNHSVALKSDGTVWTWGRDSEGQLGREISGADTSKPGVIESLGGVIAIAAISDYTAALKKDGTVWICGNVYGDSKEEITQAEGLTNIIAISAMANNLAALKKDGTVYLWKLTAYGSDLKKLEGFEDIKAISSGQFQLTALKKDGSLWTTGKNYSVSGNMSGTDPVFGEPVLINNIDKVSTIASGYNHTLILKNDGTVWAMGNNRSGQLGNGIKALSPKPFSIPVLSKIKDIFACSAQSMALSDNGAVYVWGEDVSSEAFVQGYGYISSPEEVTYIMDTKAIAANSGTYAVLKDDGTVWGWGSNIDTVKKINGLGNVTALAGGENISYQYAAIDDFGTVWECLLNEVGNSPHKVNGISNAVAAAKGMYCTLALKKDGTVWSWKNPVYYDGEPESDNIAPVKVTGLSNVTAISIGDKTCLALKKDGTVWTWDVNRDGSLQSKGGKIIPPVKVGSLSGAIAISGSTTALKKDGTVWTWGNNQYGQLGDGTFVNKITPVKVAGLKNITAISSSQFHSLALDKNGTVWSWGMNDNGQLGNGAVLYEDSFVHCLIKQ